jgi:anti-sigma factor RsiW
MDCRTFLKKHLAYLDDTLPGVEMAEMQRHLLACDACARQDASVRRALLVLRNVPAVEPTAGFSDRLRDRLRQERKRVRRDEYPFRGPSVGVFAGAGASVIALGMITVVMLGRESSSQTPPSLPAVVAYAPALADVPNEQVATPAFVASMSMGMPVWPALLLAEEGSLRFAATELQPASYTPVPQRH